MRTRALLGITQAFPVTYCFGQHQPARPPQPVLRHAPNSHFPDSIRVTGKIVDFCPGYCGCFCMGGTVKVRLTRATPAYSGRYAFLVTACLSEADTSRVITVTASKLRLDERNCYYVSVRNCLNSGLLPFYKLSGRASSKLEADPLRHQ